MLSLRRSDRRSRQRRARAVRWRRGLALIASGGAGFSVGGPLDAALATESANATRAGVCMLVSAKNL
jgi:hypothetical protein